MAVLVVEVEDPGNFSTIMTRSKLKKFEAMKTFANVYTPVTDGQKDIAAWNTQNLPVTLELACGTGAYTVQMAQRFPEKFFIGMDIKGARMWTGANLALQEQLPNVMFIRTQIERLAEILPQASVSEIWITFPDPFLAKGKAKKRLTSPRFLELYRQVLVPGGKVHLKTDSAELYAYSLESIPEFSVDGAAPFELEETVENVYIQNPPNELLTTIQTTYEKSHLKEGRTIRYLRAGLR